MPLLFLYFTSISFFTNSLSIIQRGTFLFKNRDKGTMQKSVSTLIIYCIIYDMLDFSRMSCIIILKKLYVYIASRRCFLKHLVKTSPFWIKWVVYIGKDLKTTESIDWIILCLPNIRMCSIWYYKTMFQV